VLLRVSDAEKSVDISNVKKGGNVTEALPPDQDYSNYLRKANLTSILSRTARDKHEVL
jgi:hypothetical protein